MRSTCPGYADRVGLLIPQLAFYNITGVALIGSDNWHTKDLIERAGRHAEGAVFVDGFFPESTDPAVKDLCRRLIARPTRKSRTSLPPRPMTRP